MHSLTHLVDSIQDKGVVANGSTDCGEAMHPQLKADYRHSNRQKTAEEQVHLVFSLCANSSTSDHVQMTRMSTERETIAFIRHEVNRYAQPKLTRASVPNTPSHPVACASGTQVCPSHITLGSWDNYRDVGSYEEEVFNAFGFLDFTEKLAIFLQRSGFDVHASDFNPDAGHRIHLKRMRVG